MFQTLTNRFRIFTSCPVDSKRDQTRTVRISIHFLFAVVGKMRSLPKIGHGKARSQLKRTGI